MNRETAYRLFKAMALAAKKELFKFTISSKFSIEHKADKTVVTACDCHIDNLLTKMAKEKKLDVISEEGDKQNNVVRKGTYLTIDPIDGSLGYIDHVNAAIESGDIHLFMKKELGPKSDFCLLLGIVEEGKPRFGCCYHYVTDELILLDSESKNDCIIQNLFRNHECPVACYIDPRPGESIQEKITKMPGVKSIRQATLGLKSLYTILNKHTDAITIHRVQVAGLWDIMPSAVAISAFGGILLDDMGDEAVYDKYILLPGKGATILKGNRFSYVKEELKRIKNNS